MTTCKRIFLSENGYIGLVPVGTNIGDEICLLFGGSIPFIVRNQDSYQRFIGECYCHGIMQGEVLENSDEKDIKTYIFY
ncbi:het-6-heterokaryon incompatibility protein [Rutstroemia sp. NJR-2017a WRK4]|nr:het-6-heterokaryon incompatibility protein [Rutstroemia sp. NJR-2017a WRK4]